MDENGYAQSNSNTRLGRGVCGTETPNVLITIAILALKPKHLDNDTCEYLPAFLIVFLTEVVTVRIKFHSARCSLLRTSLCLLPLRNTLLEMPEPSDRQTSGTDLYEETLNSECWFRHWFLITEYGQLTHKPYTCSLMAGHCGDFGCQPAEWRSVFPTLLGVSWLKLVFSLGCLYKTLPWKGIWKEVVVVYFEALYRHLAGHSGRAV